MATNGKETMATRRRAVPDPLALFEEHGPRRALMGMWPRLGFAMPSLLREGEWVPNIDVFERAGNTVVRVDLPGMKRDDIEVQVEHGMLVIKGHREEEKEVKEEDYTYSERATGRFSRAVSLPEGVNEGDIQATYTDGVLEVVVPLPATAPTKSTKIEVK